MPTAAERQAMIAKIQALPARLEAIVQGLSDEQLDKPGGEGDWTIRQVVHHLADSHINSFIRLKLILTEDKPTLKPYNQEAWAVLPDTTDLPVQSSLTLLKGLHERWVTLFQRLNETDWSRLGYHPEIGEITPDDLLRIYVDHGDEHIEQIKRLFG
jgi:uncharacterized damage-inducible protein DinB